MFDDPWSWLHTGASFVSGLTGLEPETVLGGACAAAGYAARPAGRLAGALARGIWRGASALCRWALVTPEVSEQCRAALDALSGFVELAGGGHIVIAGPLKATMSANGKSLCLLHAFHDGVAINLEPMLTRREWRAVEAEALAALAALKHQDDLARRAMALDALTRPAAKAGQAFDGKADEVPLVARLGPPGPAVDPAVQAAMLDEMRRMLDAKNRGKPKAS